MGKEDEEGGERGGAVYVYIVSVCWEVGEGQCRLFLCQQDQISSI